MVLQLLVSHPRRVCKKVKRQTSGGFLDGCRGRVTQVRRPGRRSQGKSRLETSPLCSPNRGRCVRKAGRPPGRSLPPLSSRSEAFRIFQPRSQNRLRVLVCGALQFWVWRAPFCKRALERLGNLSPVSSSFLKTRGTEESGQGQGVGWIAPHLPPLWFFPHAAPRALEGPGGPGC